MAFTRCLQLEVSDVPETRKAVLELLQQLQNDPAAAGGGQAAEAGGSDGGVFAPDEDAPRPGFGPGAAPAIASAKTGER